MERQFPKNVRQIGNVSDEPKIYVEDYVDTYLAQLRRKAAEKPAAAALVGEITAQEEQPAVYISGALQMKEVEISGTDIRISDDVRHDMEEKKKEYFPEKDVVGWCLIESGHPMSLNRGANKLHEKMFGKEYSIFIWKDSVENDEMFFSYKYGELMQMGGHYIYYEKNPAMQNYMISSRRQNGVTPSEVVEDRAAKNFRSAIKERSEYREQRQNSRILYATSVLLVIVVLAIGVSAMNNYDRMESVQDSLESISRSVSGTQGEAEGTGADAAEVSGSGADMADMGSSDTDAAGGDTADTDSPGADAGAGVSGADTAGTGASGSDTAEASAISGQTEEDYYVVRKGDTLDSISISTYGDSGHVDAICRMNGLSDGNLIYIGQKLLLP